MNEFTSIDFNRGRSGYICEFGGHDDEESGGMMEQRRLSNDGSRYRDRRKTSYSSHSWRNSGPPMIIREQSEMSMVSDFTSDQTYNSEAQNIPKVVEESADFDKCEAQRRMSQIRESGSFATLGLSEKHCEGEKDSSYRSITLNSLVKKDENPQEKEEPLPSDSYVRQLEVELISLKMKMAHAQSQIDEHKLLANREQTSLREFQVNLENEKNTLQIENARLKYELQEERENAQKMKVKIKEQDVVILHLKKNAQINSNDSKNVHEPSAHNHVFNENDVPEIRPSLRFNNSLADKLSQSARRLIS